MKPLVLGVVALFVGFWMVQSPDSLASFTREGADWTWQTTTMVFGAVIDFLGTLFE